MDSELELVLVARDADLPGGLHVRRAIPQAKRRMKYIPLPQEGDAPVNYP